MQRRRGVIGERVRVISKKGSLWGGSGLEVLGGASNGLSRKGLFNCGKGAFLKEKGEEFGFDSKKDEVVPRVKDVSLVDGVLEGAFGGDGYDDFAMGEGV
ncbi:hypothetical protein Tco_0281665 [Tanacetum coccineum]